MACRGVAWSGKARRGVAWGVVALRVVAVRGVVWRGVAWRGVAFAACLCCAVIFVGLCGGWLASGVVLCRGVLRCRCFRWRRAMSHVMPGSGVMDDCACVRWA